MHIHIAEDVYVSMHDETGKFPDKETGGVFLGHYHDNNCTIISMVDSGYDSVVRRPSYFEYDRVYVKHVANIIASSYKEPPRLVGLWHRHPGSLDSFSNTDHQTHRRFIDTTGSSIISMIINVDPIYRITAYRITEDMSCFRIPEDAIRVGGINQRFLEKRSISDLNSTNTRPVNKEAVSAILDAIEEEIFFEFGEGSDCGCKLIPQGDNLIVSAFWRGGSSDAPVITARLEKGRVVLTYNGKTTFYQKGLIKEIVMHNVSRPSFIRDIKKFWGGGT